MRSLADRLHELQHPSGPLAPIRKAPGPITQALALGPLAALPGSWTGHGFNAIWRPFHPEPPEANHHFLALNLTRETLTFDVIPGAVPDRGLLQPDINLYGLHYLQRISDRDGAGALHLEPGLWMNVPPSEDPKQAEATLVRMATIPHGNAVLMQTEAPQFEMLDGAPEIPPLIPFPGVPGITPFKTSEMNDGKGLVLEPKAEQDLKEDTGNNPNTNSNGPFDGAVMEPLAIDPNSLLREHLERQSDNHEEILSTTTFTVSSEARGGGIENIPFLGTANTAEPEKPSENNAFAQSARATFWIETVRAPAARSGAGGEADPARDRTAELSELELEGVAALEPWWEFETFLQLQYSQVVLLNFRNIMWPHVTVATLTLSNG
jgi:hypothetical protein